MVKIIGNLEIVGIFIAIEILIFFAGFIFILAKTNTLRKQVKKFNITLSKNLQGKNLRNINNIESLLNENDFIFLEIIADYIKTVKNSNNKRNIPDPEYYFNEDILRKNYIYHKISQNIPGILTGIGILGTFFGLVLGLASLDITEAENIRNSIPPLINSMYISFVSSLAAIALSIVYNIVDKLLEDSLNKNINNLNTTLRRHLPVRIESNLLDEIVTNQEEQLNATKEFITDTLITELVNGVKEAVDQSLTPSMESMDNNINNFVEASRTSQDNLVKGVESVVKESITPQIEEMHKVMDNLAEMSIDKQSESIDKMVDKFMKTFNQSFDNQFTALKNTLEDMIRWQKESKKEMESLVSTLQEGAVKQTDMLDYTEKLLSNVQQYVKQFDQLNNNLNNNIEQLNTLGEKLSGLEEKTNKKLEILIDRQEDFDDKRTKHLTQMEEQLNNIDEYWNSVQSNFTELNNNFSGAMEQFADSTHNSLEQTFTIFDDNLSEISNRLAVTITEINNSLEDIPNSFKQLKNLLDEFKIDREEIIQELNQQEEFLDNKLTNITSDINTKNERIEKSIVQSNEELKDNLNRNLAENIGEKLEKELSNLNDNLQEDRERKKEIINKLDYIQEKLDEPDVEGGGLFSNFRR